MKKNLLFLIVLVLSSLTSHYFGVQRGAEAATDSITLQMGLKATDQMLLNTAILLSLKNDNSVAATEIANQLVKHDVKHLGKIEKMLIKLELDEFEKNALNASIIEVKESHQLVSDL